jgi:hypothetical protein
MFVLLEGFGKRVGTSRGGEECLERGDLVGAHGAFLEDFVDDRDGGVDGLEEDVGVYLSD